MISSASLANHRFKFFGLVLTCLGIILYIILKILNYDYVEGWEDRIFMINHFVMVFGMVMIMYSSESNDDERVKHIRESLLKFFFALLVCAIMLYVIMTSLERFEGSFYGILYIIEIVLVGYLITFRISLRTNPSWIFRKPESIWGRFIVLGISIMFLIAWIIYVAVTYKR
jgi:cell division protein FtsW (lipid II flippase)